MSRRTETREETVSHEITYRMCDICKKEIPFSQIPIIGYDFQALSTAMTGRQHWWRKPFHKIVGIRKGSTYDDDRPEFDVHVGCAYDVIKEAIKK